jgi:hypothetical protein
MNFPSAEHRATWPKNSRVDAGSKDPASMLPHFNEGSSKYADSADFRSPPLPRGTGYVFTQHQGSEADRLKPLAGDLQSVGPDVPDMEQENCSALMRKRYMWRGAVGIEAFNVLAGIVQRTLAGGVYDSGTEPSAVASGLVTGVASSVPAPTSLGSEVPSSQPARRSARAEIPKKMFFIFRSPFLRCNFPHPERDVKLSFSHLVMQRDKCSYLR